MQQPWRSHLSVPTGEPNLGRPHPVFGVPSVLGFLEIAMDLSFGSLRLLLALGLPCALPATIILRPEPDVRAGKAGWVGVEVQGVAKAEVEVTLHDPSGRRLSAAEAGEIRALLPSLYLFKPAGPPRALVIRATNRLDPSDRADLPVPAPAPGPAPAAAPAAPGPFPGGLEDILPAPLIRLITEDYAGLTRAHLPSSQWPFFDPYAGVRSPGFPRSAWTRLLRNPSPAPLRPFQIFAPRPWVAAYGLPVPFQLSHAAGEGSSLVSFLDAYSAPDAGVTRLECHDDPVVELTLAGHVDELHYEDVRRSPTSSAGESRVHRQKIELRGLRPLAGDRREGGLRNGHGFQARCQPLGLAHLEGLSALAFTDEGFHSLRQVSYGGDVTLMAGEPGEAGFTDGVGAAARFNRPSFLATRPEGPVSLLAVADTGNHAVRLLNLDSGSVRTLARDLPEPQGLVLRERDVVVACRGNHTLLRIPLGGGPRLLAGAPGEPGSLDGAAGVARFMNLGGMAGHGTTLYVVDGHAVRQVDPDGRVTTLVGSVLEEGGRDLPAGSPLVPCLRRPTGLAWADGRLYIADTGNHVLRAYDPVRRCLETVAGDPTANGMEWGLLRDGLTHVPGTGYATLDRPRGLAARTRPSHMEPEACLFLGGASCLADIPAVSFRAQPSQRPQIVLGVEPLDFLLTPGGFGATNIGELTLPPYDFHYYVKFISDCEASLDAPLEKKEDARTGRGLFMTSIKLGPAPAGAARVQVRCVTTDGYSTDSTLELTEAMR